MWIVTNVWISLILLLAVAAGPGQYQSVTYPQLPPRCRCCGPSSWIFHRLYLSRCCSDARSTRSRPLCYRPLSQRWDMLATSISGGEFVPKESKMWQEKRYLWRFYPIAFTLSQHQWLGVGVSPEQCWECDLMITLPGDCQLQFLAPALTQTQPRWMKWDRNIFVRWKYFYVRFISFYGLYFRNPKYWAS